ncbi:MAG: putative selenate reductase subunit YgfK [Sphaerochaetaceae bacterium]
MGDVMRPVPFEELIERIFSEYKQTKTIFGIHEDQFYKTKKKKSSTIFGQSCSLPFGPAAGPHTQLAQNIVASYVCGGRFIELKTVQKLDELVIDKPCIDARDEGYNVEWSSEFTLDKAFNEYVKAYMILHLLDFLFANGKWESPSFIFNMSVGYDLAGIKTKKMQTFIDSMIDASNSDVFNEALNSLKSLCAEDEVLSGTPFKHLQNKISTLINGISSNISPSVTISTMHGCPPEEIEAICTYMITEKKLDTFVKLNPTLLGYDMVRTILDDLGYGYIHLKRESFEHDLQYEDAIAMIERLVALAKRSSRGFGIKLTNTLGSVNDLGILPGQECYMSGRALLPLSLSLASLLSKKFGGRLAISYSGGINAFTLKELYEVGIRPITLATDILKPGGYTRMVQMATIMEKAKDTHAIDVVGIASLASAYKSSEVVKKDFREEGQAKVDRALPLTDCYIAPCVQACPIHQDVPEYVQLVGRGQYADALELIYDKNPLPNITGYICDHQCQYHCTRLDYDGAVRIRELKRIAAENGFAAYVKRWERPETTTVKAAVIGAGPAGLSAAYFLVRAGFATEVFEREAHAGGVLRNILPAFRLPDKAIQADVDFIARHGVKFSFNVKKEAMSVDALKAQGFDYIFYAIGSEVDNDLGINGGNATVIPSLEFLKKARTGIELELGASVVVVGGGNTAMDAARVASRASNVQQVTVVYRRSEKEMPADREEYRNAIADGVKFNFLAIPEYYDTEGNLVCRNTVLGDVDASGRRKAVRTEKTFQMKADTIITAIGEKVDKESLALFGIPTDSNGYPVYDAKTLKTNREGVFIIGDAQSGPSTVVRCIASARTAVEAAIDIILGTLEPHVHDDHCGCDAHEQEYEEDEQEDLEALERAEDAFFAELRTKRATLNRSLNDGSDEAAFASTEASRCVECSYVCNKCVDVCPNRANIALDMRYRNDLFDNPFQILHIDAFCNECGNCATFCPYDGKPYRDKCTIFNLEEDFNQSENTGFFMGEDQLLVRFESNIVHCTVDPDGQVHGDIPEQISAIIEEVITVHPYLLGKVEY